MTEFAAHLFEAFHATAIPLNPGLTTHCLEAGWQLARLLAHYMPRNEKLYRRREFVFGPEAKRQMRERLDEILFAVDLLPDVGAEKQRGVCVKALKQYRGALI